MMAEDKNVGDRRTVLHGDVAVVGRLQELPTKAPLSMEASWRAVVVAAVPTMAGAGAAAGVPPRELLWRRCRAPGGCRGLWRDAVRGRGSG